MIARRIYKIVAAACGMLLVDLISSFSSCVSAFPVANTDTKDTTSSENKPTSPKSDQAKVDRSSPFQVLADGTQDLAALVGIFATNSIERYTIDYTKGYISVASTLLSLFGLLGYVRALVKLSLGLVGCQNAGFETRSLRPIYGIPDEDRLPSDVVHNVYYVERSRSAQHVTWKLTATRKHTVDSMPILDVAIPLPVDAQRRVRMISCCMDTLVEKWYRKHAWYKIPTILILMIALTCFAIVPFRGGFRYPDWTMFYATIGLFASLSICSCMWAMIYAQEQLPKGDADWIQRIVEPVKELAVRQQKPSLERKDYFAFIGSGYSYAILDLKAVTGWTRMVVHGASLGGALSAIIGVAVWIWNPTFDDFTMRRDRTETHVQMSEAHLVMLWYSHINPKRPGPSVHSVTPLGTRSQQENIHDIARKAKACPPGWYYQTIPEEFTLPNWVLHALHQAENGVHLMFNVALALCKSKGVEWQELYKKVSETQRYWDMPQWMFMLLVDAHTDEALLAQDVSRKFSNWNSYNCRIIQDSTGDFSFIPYWTTDCLSLEANRSLLKQPCLPGETLPGICVFGDPKRDECSIVTFCHTQTEADAAMPRSQLLDIGYDIFLHYEQPKRLRNSIVRHSDEMWKKLELIMNRARIVYDAKTKNEKLHTIQLENGDCELLTSSMLRDTFLHLHESSIHPGIDAGFLEHTEDHDMRPRGTRLVQLRRNRLVLLQNSDGEVMCRVE
ncbi:MAG: hypothetical protein Q9226_005473 [Calogaya cf. arnoldii]